MHYSGKRKRNREREREKIIEWSRKISRDERDFIERSGNGER